MYTTESWAEVLEEYELALDRESRGAGVGDPTVGSYFRVVIAQRTSDGTWTVWTRAKEDHMRQKPQLPAVVIEKEDTDWARVEGRSCVTAVAATRWASKHFQSIVPTRAWSLIYLKEVPSPGFGEEVACVCLGPA